MQYWLISLPLLLTAPVFAADVITLRTAAEIESAPKWINGTADGLCPDILHAIEKQDPGLRFTGQSQAIPQLRLLSYVASGELDVACGMSHRPDRDADFVVPPTVHYEDRLVAIVAAGDKLELQSLDDLKKLPASDTILLNSGARLEQRLNKMGIKQIDAGAHLPQDNLKKLIAKRGRVFLYHDIGTAWEIQQSGLIGQLRVLPTVLDVSQHYL
jgi:ABC-type amino acid transport substrate-binding protein